MPGVTTEGTTPGLSGRSVVAGRQCENGLQCQDNTQQNNTHRFQHSYHGSRSDSRNLPHFRPEGNHNYEAAR